MLGLTRSDLTYVVGHIIGFLAPYAICMSTHAYTGWFSWPCLAVALAGISSYHLGSNTAFTK